MKLWEVKAQSLRLMFADTDIEFNEEEFTDGTILNNSNTREKYIRMDDSIRRAIDLYYIHVGEPILLKQFDLDKTVIEGKDVYLNKVNLMAELGFGYPTRVDIRIMDTDGKLRREYNQVDYSYISINKELFFYTADFAKFQNENENIIVKVNIWYRLQKLNIPFNVNEITFDLNSIYIPEDVQRYIPYFVKAELYEEDEPNISVQSRQLYMNFLFSLKKPFNNVQTKVKRAKVFDK